MKAKVNEVLEYYVKLCKKIYKKKNLYFEKYFNNLYISNGDFVVIFDINIYRETYDTIQCYFNFEWNKASKYVVTTDGTVNSSILSIKENVQKTFNGQGIEKDNDEAMRIYYTGISAESVANKTQNDVWTNDNELFVYNDLYIKPFKNITMNTVNINNRNAYAAHYDYFYSAHVFILPMVRESVLDRFLDIVSRSET